LPHNNNARLSNFNGALSNLHGGHYGFNGGVSRFNGAVAHFTQSLSNLNAAKIKPPARFQISPPHSLMVFCVGGLNHLKSKIVG